jgi:hypothetical protein
MAYEPEYIEAFDPSTEYGQRQLAMEDMGRRAVSRAVDLINRHVARHTDPNTPLIDMLNVAVAYTETDEFVDELIEELSG